jgi:hypothetical protein
MINAIEKIVDKVTNQTEASILRTLTYFSIFQYPLSKEEIKTFLHPGTTINSFQNVLEQLVSRRLVYKLDEFYSLQNDRSWVTRRREGNLRAERILPTAMKIGRFLYKFPYVTGIAISGSLSKMYADEKADIDFFIITKTNRLWIARTFMHLFKKLTYFKGRQHFYCMNYYLDENALKLYDQNMYTAVETITLLPVCGEGLSDFFKANHWVSEWFREYPLQQNIQEKTPGKTWIKKTVEWLFNNKAGNGLNDYFMNLTTRRWQNKKKRGMRNEEGETMDLITGKHFARSNPGMLQEKLLTIFHAKIEDLKIDDGDV